MEGRSITRQLGTLFSLMISFPNTQGELVSDRDGASVPVIHLVRLAMAMVCGLQLFLSLHDHMGSGKSRCDVGTGSSSSFQWVLSWLLHK